MEDLWLVDKVSRHENYTAKYAKFFLLCDWLYSMWYEVNPDIPLGLTLYQGYMCLPTGVMGKKMTVSFLAPILYLNTLRAETLRSARRLVYLPTASLAEVLNLIQGFANDAQLYTSFSPNNDLEIADTSARFKGDCEI